VLKPTHYHLLTTTAWTLERFLHTGLAPFVAEYRGFAALRED
jgi:hypothetical protein